MIKDKKKAMVQLRKMAFVVAGLLLACTSLFSQQRDSRVREYITPKKIVWKQEGTHIKDEHYLLAEGNGQSDLSNSRICVMKSTDAQFPALLLDFGKEIQGGIQIVTGMPSSHESVQVRVRFGESVSEAMCDIDGKNGATNDHAMRDFKISLPWLGVAEVGNSGFRFVRIDLIDPSAELQIKEIRAISSYRDIPYKGSFKCNDERLNKIWQTGAYTVHLNMQEYLWDGVKRDRLVWIGDMHPEVMTINSVFGYNEVVPKSLDLTRDITPLPSWMNGISSYSIWWLLIHRDWYLYHGDKSYLESQKPYLKELLKLLISKIDKNGQEQLDGTRFLDWPSNANPEAINAGLQALMVQAMKYGAELCQLLGEEGLAEECKKAEKNLCKAADRVVKPFLALDKNPTEPGMKQAAALLAWTGLLDASKADKKYLSVEGGRGFSTFYGYYMLCSMALAGNYSGALDIIREYWGAMLDMGATTFWEDFNLDWLPNAAPIDAIVPAGKKDIHGDFGAYCYTGFRHSLCHGWASGPTSWLMANVLGVKVVEPACSVLLIEPHLADLEWVEGTFPTPKGIVKIRHDKRPDGSVASKVEAPDGIKIIVKEK